MLKIKRLMMIIWFLSCRHCLFSWPSPSLPPSRLMNPLSETQLTASTHQRTKKSSKNCCWRNFCWKNFSVKLHSSTSTQQHSKSASFQYYAKTFFLILFKSQNRIINERNDYLHQMLLLKLMKNVVHKRIWIKSFLQLKNLKIIVFIIEFYFAVDFKNYFKKVLSWSLNNEGSMLMA